MNWKAKMVLLSAVLLAALATAACEQEGEMEKMGKEIDQAVSSMKEKIHQATE